MIGGVSKKAGHVTSLRSSPSTMADHVVSDPLYAGFELELVSFQH